MPVTIWALRAWLELLLSHQDMHMYTAAVDNNGLWLWFPMSPTRVDFRGIKRSNAQYLYLVFASSSSFLACNSYDCIAPYVGIILHRGRFWAKSAASGSVRWCCFRSCWTVLSHVMRGWPSCLLQLAGGEANRILLASALSSVRIICPNGVSRRDWIIAVSLGCFDSLCTSSFPTNWYHLMPSSIRRHHWSSASILRASVLDITQQRWTKWICKLKV